MKVIQRFTLHRNERIIGTFQRQTIGHILVGQQHTTHRMRYAYIAQCAPIGKVEELFFRLHQIREDTQVLFFECGEIGLLR